MKVRPKQPIRRPSPSYTGSGASCNWGNHKPELKIDFHSYCGYCGSYDGFRHTYFEVDHFVPKSLFELNGNIDLCQYSNLTYSCKFCNNIKGSKWPTKNEAIHNRNSEGFVDACDVYYEDHLYRTLNGGIMWKTPLGKWMATEAFKFDQREPGIILLWNLDQLRTSINSLIKKQKKYSVGSPKYDVIKEKLGGFAVKYFEFHQELMDFYNE